MAATHHPLDISELRIHIATFLDSTDHKACMLVCKAWYMDLLPVLWGRSTFYAGKFMDCAPEDRPVRLEVLRTCAPWIKDLFLHYHGIAVTHDLRTSLMDAVVQGCRSLEVVSLPLHLKAGHAALYRSAIGMLELNATTLQRVTLLISRSPLNDGITIPDLALHRTLSTFPHLRYLELDCCILIKDVILILESCTKLETLALARHRKTLYSERSPSPSNVVMDNAEGDRYRQWLSTLSTLSLRHLHIGAACIDWDLGTLLARCRLLESLYLTAIYDQAIPMVKEALQGSRCFPLLTRFGFNIGNMPDFQRHLVIQSFPPQQLREAYLYLFSKTDIHLMVKQQHETLETITCHSFSDRTGLAIARILHDCKRLRKLTFNAGRLNSFVDIRRSLAQPWRCPLLEEMDVPFELDTRCTDPYTLQMGSAEKRAVAPGQDEKEQAEILFMKRLGAQSHLKRLRLYSGFDRDRKRTYMQWSLATGVEHLAGLSRLERLDFDHQVLPLGVTELQFLKGHWVSLKELQCGSIHLPEIRRWLNQEWPELRVITLHEYSY
ncbi:hypothetical protein DFQ27_003890 [Actinomortierella ambigua]|uniref:F-box domain-containing protein n=1 Tax=Actinomortierella ambigua TaxID=1343610 RepID=A0A9P6Q3F6_9FUNG|nr:hypothetical protein DFQ27_003890 [Actinomortierella ambigua]